MSAVPVVEPAALELRSVESGYGETTILRDVSLTVPRSTVVALLGPNGAGKSTLLKTASGHLRPTKGSVWRDGVDVTRMPTHKRARQGMCHIPEGAGIYRSLTVRENLVMQAMTAKERGGAIDRAADAFPILRQRLSQNAGTLSGGQQQMLAMAAAYVRDPELVLVDEASLGLAPLVVDEIFSFLATLRSNGAALLIVDQFVTRALDLADHVYLLNQGEIEFDGTPGDLRADDVFRRYLGTAAAEDEARPLKPT
jgi:branched-chain amino acid transport system ATP-binding protein